MERSSKPRLLVLLLALIQVCHGEGSCSSDPGNNITCSSDYNRTITCVWNSAYDHSDSVCTIEALNKKHRSRRKSSKASCTLKPVEGSSTQMTCNMEFFRDEIFQSTDIFSMNLTCNPGPANVTMCFQPAHHIKLNPPQQPHINFTTISWHPQVKETEQIKMFKCQLQWKQEKQSCSDPSVQKNTNTYSWEWEPSGSAVKLDDDWLIRGQRYEARVRVKSEDTDHSSTWSGWSPTASWVSTVGRTKQPQPPSDLAWRVLGLFAAAFAVLLVIVLFKTDKTTWVVKKIKGPPIPNPEKSFLKDLKFKSRSSPHFLIASGELDSVEISSYVDAVLPCSQKEALLHKTRSEMTHKSTSSDFSNPNYSHLLPQTPPPHMSSLTAGNLPQCVSDAPYGPVGGQRSEKETDEDRGKKEEEEIHQLFSKGSEAMLLVSDYERVEELKGERGRLQSLDSGVGSGGEGLSQESMEEEREESMEEVSITVEEVREENKKREEEREEERVDFHKMFGRGGEEVSQESMEEVREERGRLQSLDSGVGSGGEEVSQESMEEVSQDSMEEEREESMEEVSITVEEVREENKKKEEEREEERVDFHKMFGRGGEEVSQESMEEVREERGRLQSLDSGVGSGGEEVSQESMEEVSQDSMEEEREESMEEVSITVEEVREENKKKEEEREEQRVDFHKMFGGGGIQVCSGYKKMHLVEEEEEETEELLFSPPTSCSSPSLPSPPSLPSLGFSEGLKPDLLERMFLMSSSRSVAPSGGGYMPVRQEQS